MFNDYPNTLNAVFESIDRINGVARNIVNQMPDMRRYNQQPSDGGRSRRDMPSSYGYNNNCCGVPNPPMVPHFVSCPGMSDPSYGSGNIGYKQYHQYNSPYYNNGYNNGYVNNPYGNPYNNNNPYGNPYGNYGGMYR